LEFCVKAIDYPKPFQDLAKALRRLPGIGPRSAERIALWLVADRGAGELAESIRTAAAAIHPCPRCGFFATGELCEICSDPGRSGGGLCVVENATDVIPLERAGGYHGCYHVLGGRLSPLDHIGPDQLRIHALMERIPGEKPTEIILALSADVEGEATTLYLADLLRESAVTVTRIAHGLPAGGGLEHADALTLQRALAGRRAMGI
jgi:recombination protein RecR